MAGGVVMLRHAEQAAEVLPWGRTLRCGPLILQSR
jgi:hypothetical protein